MGARMALPLVLFLSSTVGVFPSEVILLPEPKKPLLQDVFIDGKKMACFLDGCYLICKGDQVEANLCHTFGIDLPAKSCAFHDCNLLCGEQLVRSFCESTGHLKGSRRTSIVTKERIAENEEHSRRLQKASVFEGSTDNLKIWPKAQICYKIDAHVNEFVVREAISHWRNHTELEFLPCSGNDTDNDECCSPCGEYINFVNMTGCWSGVGRDVGKCRSGGQPLSVGDGCDTGSIIHEIGHAVGLIHEHVRADRDSYVRVMKKNIQTDHVADFDLDSDPYYTVSPYNYDSIMHYGLFSFTKNQFATLIPLVNGKPDLSVPIGQRAGLSVGDIASVHRMYSRELELREY